MTSPIIHFSDPEKAIFLTENFKKIKDMLFTPDRELDPPNEPETAVREVCANCKEEEPTYILGISTYGLKPDDRVCNFCLGELLNNISLTN